MEHLGHDQPPTLSGTNDTLNALSFAPNAAPPGPTQHAIHNNRSQAAHQTSIAQDPYQHRTDLRPVYHGSRIELPAFLRAIFDKLPQNVTLYQFAANGYYSHHTNGKTVVPNKGMAHAIDRGAYKHPRGAAYDLTSPAPLDPPADPPATRGGSTPGASSAWTIDQDSCTCSAHHSSPSATTSSSTSSPSTSTDRR